MYASIVSNYVWHNKINENDENWWKYEKFIGGVVWRYMKIDEMRNWWKCWNVVGGTLWRYAKIDEKWNWEHNGLVSWKSETDNESVMVSYDEMHIMLYQKYLYI